MNNQYWIERWKAKETQFHQETVHEALLQHGGAFSLRKEGRVLVPLCGKTNDMVWFREQGIYVDGIEVSEQAVTEFFQDNALGEPCVTLSEAFSLYEADGYRLYCGDFFEFNREACYDYVYDRGSLVALPPEKRSAYARIMMKALRDNGRYVLIAYEYDSEDMTGPPFSLSQDEIHVLFGEQCAITLLDRKQGAEKGSRLSAVPGLTQTVTLLEKRV